VERTLSDPHWEISHPNLHTLSRPERFRVRCGCRRKTTLEAIIIVLEVVELGLVVEHSLDILPLELVTLVESIDGL
jgi:hypothetical protein